MGMILFGVLVLIAGAWIIKCTEDLVNSNKNKRHGKYLMSPIQSPSDAEKFLLQALRPPRQAGVVDSGPDYIEVADKISLLISSEEYKIVFHKFLVECAKITNSEARGVRIRVLSQAVDLPMCRLSFSDAAIHWLFEQEKWVSYSSKTWRDGKSSLVSKEDFRQDGCIDIDVLGAMFLFRRVIQSMITHDRLYD